MTKHLTRLRRLAPALLLTAALPGSGWAEMTGPEREAFRAEVRAYLLENPEILSEMVAILEARQREATAAEDAARIAAEAGALFDDGFSLVLGNPDGDVTVVEFVDYQCGFCRRAHPEVRELLARDGGLRLILKELPILGPASEHAARVAHAVHLTAGPEAYAALNDRLMRLDGPASEAAVALALEALGIDGAAVAAAMTDPEVDRRLGETRALAAALGIEGTPSFVFGDRLLRGYAPLAAMESLVAEAREGG